jgi:glycosyltransferase involved in cell wall biosynthesis
VAKILIVGSHAESLTDFRGPLIREWLDAGHEVLAVAPMLEGPVRERLQSWGVDCRSIPMRRQGLNPVSDLQTLAALAVLMRRERPDVFLGYTIKPILYGVAAARLAGVPRKFAMITGGGAALSDEVSPLGRVVRLVARLGYRLSLRHCNRVYFQNPDDLRYFTEHRLLDDQSKAVIIAGSGVDLAHFNLAPPPEGVSFLMIARFLRDKGIREYVQAAREIRRNHPDVQFQLAGWSDGGPAAIPRHEVDAWAEEGVIENLGRLEDVRPAIARCAVYVLPSYREGMPRTVLEAMAMGRPIITTDSPGCRETVSDGMNGFLVPTRDAVALSRAMRRFVESPDLVARMGARSRAMAEARFDVRIVNRLLRKTMEL